MIRRTAAPHPLALLVGVLVAVLAAAAGCGVPTDGSPRAITAESTTTAPAASSSGPASGDAVIYLSTPTVAATESEAGLVGVPRNLGAPPTPTTVLEALFDGPTQEEQDQRDLLTLIPDGTNLIDATLQDTVLSVELSEEWSALLGPDLLGAYAQVVLTATALNEVTRVRFSVDGEPIDDVPTEGDPKTTVTRGDYIGLIAPGG